MSEAERFADRIINMQYAIDLELKMLSLEIEAGKRYKKEDYPKIIDCIENLQLRDFTLILERLKSLE